MYSIKYYVFLMIGIFLALGLGMMIGIALENEDIIENQQISLVKQIEDRFVSLRDETNKLKDELQTTREQRDSLENLSGLLFDETVRYKLSGLNVALISFAQNSYTKELLDFLPLTGASVQSNIEFSVSSLPVAFGSELTAAATQNQNELISAAIGDIVYCMSYGGITPLIQEMEDLEIIRNTGMYEKPVDVLILLGQGSATREYDMLLLNNAINAGIPVVAVEAGEITSSAIADYKTYGISTVDHIDTIYGKLALTSILSGSHGSYGYGSEAQGLLPSPLFIGQEQHQVQNDEPMSAEMISDEP